MLRLPTLSRRKGLTGVAVLTPVLSNPSIAFPFRLQQGLLQKTSEREAYLMLLEIMARTRRGSWAGHPLFGFQQFFAEMTKEGLPQETRNRIADRTTQEINTVLTDLGLTRYHVDSLALDSPQPLRTTGFELPRSVILMLRESGSERASGYLL
jgi:hypothetical protein